MGTPQYMAPEQARGEVADARRAQRHLQPRRDPLPDPRPAPAGHRKRRHGPSSRKSARAKSNRSPHRSRASRTIFPAGGFPTASPPWCARRWPSIKSSATRRSPNSSATSKPIRTASPPARRRPAAWKQFLLLVKRHKTRRPSALPPVLLVGCHSGPRFSSKAARRIMPSASQRARSALADLKTTSARPAPARRERSRVPALRFRAGQARRRPRARSRAPAQLLAARLAFHRHGSPRRCRRRHPPRAAERPCPRRSGSDFADDRKARRVATCGRLARGQLAQVVKSSSECRRFRRNFRTFRETEGRGQDQREVGSRTS